MFIRLAGGLLLCLVSACSSFDFGDALSTAAVFGEASEIRACQNAYRDAGDSWRYDSCVADASN